MLVECQSNYQAFAFFGAFREKRKKLPLWSIKQVSSITKWDTDNGAKSCT